MGAGLARDRIPGGRRLIALDGYEVSPEEEALTRTPAQRAALTAQIEGSLLQMHAFWLSLRQAVAERERARRRSPKWAAMNPAPAAAARSSRSAAGRHLGCTDPGSRQAPKTDTRKRLDSVLGFACGWGSLLLDGRRQAGKAGGGCLAEVDSDSLHNNVIFRPGADGP